MPPVLVIAEKDLRQRFRDRSAIVLGFVAPLAIAMLMSFAFRNTSNFHITVDLVDNDHGQLAAAFHEFLTSPELHDVVTLGRVTDEATASARVHHGDAAAAIVVPPGFTHAATGTGATDLTVLTSTNSQLGGQVSHAIADSFVAQLNADRVSVATALAAGAPPQQIARLTEDASSLRLPEQIASRPIGARPLKAISYYAPAMAIFFVLFAIGFTARSFYTEQESGMLDRIGAAPLRPGTVLIGKSLSVLVYGVASLATVIVVTSLLFGADWGNLFAAGLISFAMVTAVVALTAFVIAVSRTERQAEGLASIIVFGLALLGGNFVTISSAPPLMRRLALLTPNGWALRGYVDLSTGAHGLGVVLQPVGAIVLFTVIISVLAVISGSRLARS